MNISTKSKERQWVPYLPQPTQMGFYDLMLYNLCRDKLGEDLRSFIFEN